MTGPAPSRPGVALIWAQDERGVIGRDGALPWHLPEDLAHFRALTRGATVLMGRATWESLPERFRPLPGRRNVVLSRQAGYVASGAEVRGSLAVRYEAEDRLGQEGGVGPQIEGGPEGVCLGAVIGPNEHHPMGQAEGVWKLYVVGARFYRAGGQQTAQQILTDGAGHGSSIDDIT